jgi:putative cell wall-binding protein
VASAFAIAVVGTITTVTVAAPAAYAATDEDPSFRLIPADLEFMLRQIEIAEAHAAGGQLLCDDPTDTSYKCVPDPALPYGLRTVDGSFNNLIEGQQFFGAADQPFPRLADPYWRDADPAAPGAPPNPAGATDPCDDPASTCYRMFAPDSFVYDSHPREISNLIVDQSTNNPAALNHIDAGTGQQVPGSDSIFIPNTTADEELSAPVNLWFVLFGQFFDHGLDLIDKGGNGVMVVPLQPDDPLYDITPPNQRFLLLDRATRLPGPDGVIGTDDDEHFNETTPWVDQNQTYTSHPAHQVFLREYELRTVEGYDGMVPVDTGRLLESNGGLATWADVKAQARNVLGIDLVDEDVLDVPMLATDLYGNFARGESGFPQIITETGALEGNPDAPISTAEAGSTRHAFIDDIAHGAVPGTLAGYDNALLDEHFVTGDGRGNENIGLSAVHHVFHSEHNRLTEHVESVLGSVPELDAAFRGLDNAYVPLMGGPAFMPEADNWTYEQRLFQAAKFATEMQYQHLVFEEFARTVQPAIDPIVFNENSYNAHLNPAIQAEFANVVYRFGHSMLTEDIVRDGFGAETVSLLDGFLNPRTYDNEGALTPDQAAGAIVNGTTDQVANQVDEHVIDTLRNNLLGLPLDLATINMLRARDTGTPPLQEARRIFFEESGKPNLAPYANWTDFGLGLKNGNLFGRGGNKASLVNFVAAYGTHPTVVNAVGTDAKRAAAALLVNGAPLGEEFLTRLAGSDRFQTAAMLSQSQFNSPGVPTVYVTNGLNFPDALAGGPAAAAAGSPILLVHGSTGEIPSATADELTRLAPQSITVLGGPGAVSAATMTALEGYTAGPVTRVAGADRFETAAQISQNTFDPGVGKVFIANGLNFPDALSASAIAARDGAPVLLVRPGEIPAATAAELERLNPGEIVIAGGTSVVSTAVQTALGAYTGGAVSRVAGADRYATSVAMSQAHFADGSTSRAYIATGTNFPDALAAAPIAGLNDAPLLLVPPTGVPQIVLDELERLGVTELVLLGGLGALPLGVEQSLMTLAPDLNVDVPADRFAFMDSTAGTIWENVNGETVTGLESVDFWMGGLAEALDPFGGMLGTSFNYVFERQLEQLQFGDRFYYLFRNQGNQLFAALEANSFSKLIQRNTDASYLPASIFVVPDPTFRVGELDANALPEGLLRDANGMWRWPGEEHIELHGTPENDLMRAGQGDDSLWGYEGDDRLEGGSGNDQLIGGPGNDLLTDTFGDDNLKGGLGNDVLSGGPGEDLYLPSHGDDFTIGGGDPVSTFFMGTGDDVHLGGAGLNERVFGGEGDDWIEGGASAGLIQGDNANQHQNDPNGGHDVVFGGQGNDDIEGEGGDDVLVGQAQGVDRHEGMMGYDWVTYQGAPMGVDADMRFTTLQRPDVQAVRDRFDLVEALSGSSHDDVLRGMGKEIDDIPDWQKPLHRLTEEGLDRILGLRDLLEPEGNHANYADRFRAGLPVADTDGVSNLLLGGSGGDVIQGRGGDDFLDGDAYLKVQLEVDGVRYDSAQELRAMALSGSFDPGSIDIVREIVTDADATEAIDVAEYSGAMSEYTITGLGDGYYQVAHTTATEFEESEGVDVIRNFEVLQFSDGCMDAITFEVCETIATVDLSTLAFEEDVPVTATVVFNDPAQAALATGFNFRWFTGEVGEAWDPSDTDNGLVENTISTEFTPGDADSGAIMRTVVTFQIDGVTYTAASPASEEVINRNDLPVGPTIAVDGAGEPVVGAFIDIVGAVLDGDGQEDSLEPGGRTATWQTSTDGVTWVDFVGPIVDDAANPAFTTIEITDALQGLQLRVVVTYTDDLGTTENAESNVIAIP